MHVDLNQQAFHPGLALKWAVSDGMILANPMKKDSKFYYDQAWTAGQRAANESNLKRRRFSLDRERQLLCLAASSEQVERLTETVEWLRALASGRLN